VSSFVAAGLAGASMWQTGWVGMQLSAIALLLPFVWAYDPALLLDGSVISIVIVICTTMAAILVLSRAILKLQAHSPGAILFGIALTVLAYGVGASLIWLGSESLWCFAVAAIGAAVYAVTPVGGQVKRQPAMTAARDSGG